MPKKAEASNALEIQNAAKTLLANIRFSSPDEPVRLISLTSAVPNEGKTLTSIMLARAIASSGNSVLLVESDMRRRSVAGRLDLHPASGLYSVLTGQVSIENAIVSTPTPNMYFLDVEPNIPNPIDILSSRRYARLIDTLDQMFDYVLFDTPPVGTFVDAALLSGLVDGTIMVVKMNSTKREDLTNAYTQLSQAGGRILGLCATFCENTGSEYYYAYYTQSGERVSSSQTKIERGESGSKRSLIGRASHRKKDGKGDGGRF